MKKVCEYRKVCSGCKAKEELAIDENTINDLKDELQSRHSKPNSSFEKGIDNYIADCKAKEELKPNLVALDVLSRKGEKHDPR